MFDELFDDNTALHMIRDLKKTAKRDAQTIDQLANSSDYKDYAKRMSWMNKRALTPEEIFEAAGMNEQLSRLSGIKRTRLGATITTPKNKHAH